MLGTLIILNYVDVHGRPSGRTINPIIYVRRRQCASDDKWMFPHRVSALRVAPVQVQYLRQRLEEKTAA